jgi:membrane associated rhomboid family serine protease
MFNNIDTKSVTFNLIVMNVLLYIISNLFPSLYQYLSLHYIFNTHHYLEHSNFLPIQIITHMFMHAPLESSIGIGHIFFNMFGLFMFGSILERVWGAQRFLLFYMITGFGAVVLHMAVQMILVLNYTGVIDPTIAMLNSHPEAMGTYFTPTVGASGAIFGLLTAFALLFPNTELYLMFIPVPVRAKYFVTFYILMELYLGFSMYGGDNVAHFAHLGGALFGFLLVRYWNKNRNSLY